MKWNDWLEKWGMSSLKINLKFLEMDFKPQDPDRGAAWDLYVELLTRIATQHLRPDEGDEKTALDSMYALFSITRQTMKHHGRGCAEFSKIAVVVLNQVVRPFTAKWHRFSLAGAFDEEARCDEFRRELSELQGRIRQYTQMLADMAGVEDLSDLEVGE